MTILAFDDHVRSLHPDHQAPASVVKSKLETFQTWEYLRGSSVGPFALQARAQKLRIMIWRYLRYGARMPVKNSGFSLIAVTMLAAGIGANTAAFSVVNAAPLKPLPVAQPDELVSLYTSDFSGPRYGASSFLDYVDLRDRADILSGLIAYWRQSVRIKNVEQAEDFITADIA